MSILEKWVIWCDCDECESEYVGEPAGVSGSRQETFYRASHAGWGFVRIRPERGLRERKMSICPSCRERAYQELNPRKFFRDVTVYSHKPTEFGPGFGLSCGHEFGELNPPPVDGKWECTACKLGWFQCGRVTELPAEFREANKKGSPELRRYDANPFF